MAARCFSTRSARFRSNCKASSCACCRKDHFERVGEERTRSVDVRVIAATNRDLKQEVQRGRFPRRSLFSAQRVSGGICLAARTTRRYPLLAQHFLSSESKALKSDLRLSEADARKLSRYDWPGNVRELQNVIERAAILAQNGRLRIDLPDGHRCSIDRSPQGRATTSDSHRR